MLAAGSICQSCVCSYAYDLAKLRDGRKTRIAGCVIARQRPGTAKGFVFLSLEDETGISNAIVEAMKRECLFQRMYVFTLNIFNQLGFDTSRVREFDDANRHFFQCGEFGGTQPPRSGNDLVLIIFDGADKQWLQDALCLKTECQFRKAVFIKASAWGWWWIPATARQTSCDVRCCFELRFP